MACNKDHLKTDFIIKDLQINQSGFGRHKCASCAYEKGLENGKNLILNFNLESYILSLDESQKGLRRHKDPLEAYTIGFFHGLQGPQNHPIIKDKLKMAAQMRDFGLYMVGRGAVNATFSEVANPYSHAMSVVHVAHGFEILIKSRIVEEHPLLIFTKIPTESKIGGEDINIENLLEHGQTIMYSELPHRLWAATGYKLPDLKLYESFGKIRNQIIHFSIPSISLSDQTLNYTYQLVEKSVNEWWDTTILEYASGYDDCYCEYVFEQLKRLKIEINYKIDKNGDIVKITS